MTAKSRGLYHQYWQLVLKKEKTITFCKNILLLCEVVVVFSCFVYSEILTPFSLERIFIQSENLDFFDSKMPLGQRPGDKSESRYCGIETEFHDDMPHLLTYSLSGGFDFVVAPLVSNRYCSSLFFSFYGP